jgi:hypothetical protein
MVTKRAEVRMRAVALRRIGWSYGEIRKGLGVSKGTLSLWLRDVPLADEHREALDRRKREAAKRGVRTIKSRGRERERRLAGNAAGQVTPLTNSELFIAGVVAYWAEGTKSKPWRRNLVRFTNSDPGMILLFLAWLDLLGISGELVAFRLAIHESADMDRSLRFWSEVVGVPAEEFKRTTLKRGNPRTARRNVSEEYHGCLRVEVQRSTDLNARIRGWFQGILSNLPRPSVESNQA